MTVDAMTTTAELVNASLKPRRPGVSVVTSRYRSREGWKNSLGLVFASVSLLNELRTIQKTGKKKIRATSHAKAPSDALTHRFSPTARPVSWLPRRRRRCRGGLTADGAV